MAGVLLLLLLVAHIPLITWAERVGYMDRAGGWLLLWLLLSLGGLVIAGVRIFRRRSEPEEDRG